jgi:hydroxyacylglutathione hydrolase
MPLELVTIPCLKDNYAFLVHNAASGETALIDAPEAAPVLTALTDRGWTLTDILLTHHHADHIQAVPEILAATGAKVIGAAADTHRLPPLNQAVADRDVLTVCGSACHVIDVSGHTIGHIAFHFPTEGLVFTADSLMAMGCGRLFEGSPAQMWASLSKLAALPPETILCSGHEYTAANLRFALTLEPGNPALMLRSDRIAAQRAAGRPTVPSILRDELETNPFLRAGHPDLKAAVGLPDAPDVVVFAEIRARKDKF